MNVANSSIHRLVVPSLDQVGISIVIPNRNGLHLLPRCVEFLGRVTSPFELIIVDNGSDDPGVPPLYRQLGERLGAHVLPFNLSFNYARMINIGVAAAQHDFVLLLNNDVVIPEPDLLARALDHAAQPAVGVVGSLLRYPDGLVQHAGMLLRMSPEGTCEVDHVLRFARQEEGGYPGALTAPREWQAVTGAFQLMRTSVFLEAGGYDEVNLPVEYNDVDFCLRVRAMGLKVMCLPLEGIVHDESHTRSRMESGTARRLKSEARDVMKARWASAFADDPFRNLDIDRKDRAGIDRPPKVPKTLSQRLARWKRRMKVKLGTMTGGADPANVAARAQLPLRLQPGVSIVGHVTSAGELGAAARLFGQACAAVHLPVGHVDLPANGRQEPANAPPPCEPYPHRQVSLCIAALHELEAALPGLGEGRIRIACPYFHDPAAVISAAGALDRFEEIWAPSTFAAQALRAVSKTPVRLMPQPLQIPAIVPAPDGEAKLRVMTQFDRHVPFDAQHAGGVISAFQMAFPAGENVELLVALRGGARGAMDRRIAKAARGDSRIRIIDLEDEGSRKALDGAQVFLSLNDADCAGLRVGEALARGQAVVATAWGPAADMVTTATGFPVARNLRTAHQGSGSDAQQGEPDLAAAAAALRDIAADLPAALRRGSAGRALIARDHGLEAAGARIAAALRDLGVDLSGQ